MLKFYNTLSRRKEEFVPVKEKVATMYSCGPTVYNYAHIGNLRTYVFMDLLRRALKMNGYKLKGVLNITDVGHLVSDSDTGEDKMELAAKRTNKDPYEIAEYYTEIFFEDLKKLNISRPEIVPKATDHIKEMIDYVVELVDKGYAYETSDGIYFDIAKFEDYGKLSRIKLEEQKAGARVETNDEKRNPADFALWKKAPKEHIMQWESPWGMGYPGWHIECSAMGRKYLGKVFDIHSGGVDHIPIHHENEIAQNEAASGEKTVNYWMHGEFMLVDGGKMSKSLGNTYTITNLAERGYAPLDFRYFCLNTHYRKKLNFTFEALSAAKTARERLNALVWASKTSQEAGDTAAAERYLADFEAAVSDDLNVPMALGIAWTMLKSIKGKAVYSAVLKMDKVLGLDLDKVTEPVTDTAEEIDIPIEVTELAVKRLEAKKNKDFALADTIRGQIEEKGYAVADTKDGYKLTLKQ